MAAHDKGEFQAKLSCADMVNPDGMPSVWPLQALESRGVGRIFGHGAYTTGRQCRETVPWNPNRFTMLQGREPLDELQGAKAIGNRTLRWWPRRVCGVKCRENQREALRSP
jgi:hypothetical protein